MRTSYAVITEIINGGRQGENLATAVYFDLSEMISEFGEGTFAIVHRRANDATPYPVTHTERIEDSAVWTLDATDTASAGIGRVELRWYVDEVLAKTVVYAIAIQTSLGVTGDVPDPYEDIIDTIAGYAQDAEDARDAAQGYAGTASQSAIDAAASERAAGASETAAAESERAASGYAQTASDKADAASSSAQTASDKASEAQGYAQTASGKASEAQGYAQTASNKADAAAASAQTASDKADAASSAAQSVAESAAQIAINTANIAKKADAIVKSASGAVASFPDGGDGMPMVSVVAQIEPKQSGSGDPSPSNVRPISGWGSVNVVRSGKNLFDLNLLSATGITIQNGEASGSASAFHTAFSNGIPNLNIPNSRVTISFDAYTDGDQSTDGNGLIFGFVYSDGTTANIITIANSVQAYTHYTATSAVDKKVAAITITYASKGSNTWHIKNIQLEVGTTATAYKPYVGQTITIPLGQSIYGGTLDVGKGELVIDRAEVTFDGDNVWSAYASQNGFLTGLDDMVIGRANSGLSNWLPTIPYATVFGLLFGANNNVLYACHITDNMSDITDVASWKTYLASNPLQVVYPLAEPISVTLTPTEVDSLLADNNVWADSGDVSVVYRADSTLAYEQLINAIISLGGNV